MVKQLAVYLLTLCCLLSSSLLSPGRTETTPGQDRPNRALEPPPSGERPTEVSVGLQITNLAQVDEVLERFSIRGTLFARWRDARLAARPGDAVEPVRIFKPGEIWQPELLTVNGVSVRETRDVVMTADPDGVVNYAEAFAVSLSSQFELQAFPFDSESLLTVIRPLRAPNQNLLLIPDLERTGFERERWAELAQWKVAGLTATTRSVVTLKHLPRLPEIEFNLKVRRRCWFYIWKVFLPLLVMVVISWSTFWIQINDQYSQMTIALTTILTVIAFAFSISVSLPRLPYLSLIDAFFLMSYLFVFFSIVEVITIHNMLIAGREAQAKRIRGSSRWLFPLAYLAVNTVVISLFLLT